MWIVKQSCTVVREVYPLHLKQLINKMRRADAQTGRKKAGYHLGKVPHLAPALLPKHHQHILSTVMFAYSVNEGINVGTLERNPGRARKVYRAPDNRYQDRLKRNLMETAVKRGDAWGREVAGHLSGIIDLVAEEALYHLRCRTLFEHSFTNTEVRRPIDEERQLLFEKLCLWIDEGVEHGITTLAEIHRKMEELDPSEDKSLAYSPRYLKIKLQEQYEESLYFTSDERRTDIVCLRDMTNAILRDYRQQILNPSQTLDAELKELTISTAINLICGDLARVPLDQK